MHTRHTDISETARPVLARVLWKQASHVAGGTVLPAVGGQVQAVSESRETHFVELVPVRAFQGEPMRHSLKLVRSRVLLGGGSFANGTFCVKTGGTLGKPRGNPSDTRILWSFGAGRWRGMPLPSAHFPGPGRPGGPGTGGAAEVRDLSVALR